MVDQKEIELYGSGRPYEYEPQLDAGEKDIVDIRDEQFYKYAPYDSLTIINQSNQPIVVKLDDADERAFNIAPNQSRTITGRWYRLLGLINRGSGEIVEGDLTLEIERRPMDADKKAFNEERDKGGMLSNVVEHFTGVNLGGR